MLLKWKKKTTLSCRRLDIITTIITLLSSVVNALHSDTTIQQNCCCNCRLRLKPILKSYDFHISQSSNFIWQLTNWGPLQIFPRPLSSACDAGGTWWVQPPSFSLARPSWASWRTRLSQGRCSSREGCRAIEPSLGKWWSKGS